MNYGRWPNPTRQDKKGALAISPSIFILTEIAGGVVGVTIHGLAVEAPVVALLRWLQLLPVEPLKKLVCTFRCGMRLKQAIFVRECGLYFLEKNRECEHGPRAVTAIMLR